MAVGAIAPSVGLILAMLLSAPPAVSQTQIFDGAASERQAILVMNQEKLLRNSKTGQALLKREGAMRDAHRDEGLRLDAELEAEERDLAEKRKTLPADEFAVLAVEFDSKVVATRRNHNQKSENLATTIENTRKQFFAQIVPIVAQIMRERRADLVFEQRNVLFTGPNVDITDEVILRLDQIQNSQQ